MTRTMARLESILTQILFDFSLQIRVAAERTETSSSDSKKEGTSSVIGKINNLATVDIANTTATRDLVLVGEDVYSRRSLPVLIVIFSLVSTNPSHLVKYISLFGSWVEVSLFLAVDRDTSEAYTRVM
jgi:hypothetical protein